MLHRQLAELCRFAVQARTDRCLTTIDVAIRRDEAAARVACGALGLREAVTDPYMGTVFAALEIGRTIAALAGTDAMRAAFDFIEINVGEREAVWLGRRWAGITDPTGATWG